ncbi:MAG: hypothetical protein H6741_01125 [Alphaproteobacteria bacterium]|nr:hypothetical protein [Alphaproteobacteria bacterium]MCB9791301.1 hypothetical protein [Alphaproteobacteria bacterium]
MKLTWRMPVTALLLGLGLGCGEDPALKAAREQAEKGEAGVQPGQAGTPSPGQAGTPAQPQPGRPGDPPPGKPGDPSPGEPGDPKPGVPGQPDGIGAPEGPTVTIRGSIRLDDWSAGAVRIDVFDGDHSALGGPRPGIVTRAEIPKPGPFEIVVSEGSRLWLSAFNDENQDGRPSPIEPYGEYSRNPVVANGDVEGVELVLERRDPPDQRGR